MKNSRRLKRLLFYGEWYFLSDGVSFIRKDLSLRARLNLLLQLLSNQLRIPVTLGIPYCLTIEPASICNLKCTTCPAGLKREMCSPALLKLEDFKKVIDLCGEYLTYIQLWSWGEPFLNPFLPEMIAYAKKYGIIVVSSTNGHYLHDENNVKKLVDSGLDELILAVDGTTQEVYEKYRQGGDLGKVLAGIRNLVELRKREGVNSPRLHMRMVVNPYNEMQIDEYASLAESLGVDLVSFKKIDTGMGGVKGNMQLLPQNQHYVINFRDHLYKYKCKNFWNFPVLSSSGKIGLCSLDSERMTDLAHINDIYHFKKAWNSYKAKKCRRAMKKDADAFQFCRECTSREPDFKNAYFNIKFFKGWAS